MKCEKCGDEMPECSYCDECSKKQEESAVALSGGLCAISKIEKGKKIEKQLIDIVTTMAAESMEPIHFENFSDAIEHMMTNRKIST